MAGIGDYEILLVALDEALPRLDDGVIRIHAANSAIQHYLSEGNLDMGLMRAAARSDTELTPEQQDERLKYSDIPKNKGISGGISRTYELFHIGVTEHYLRRAVSQGRLARHEIGHVIHFSDRDLYDFIVLGTRKPSKRA